MDFKTMKNRMIANFEAMSSNNYLFQVDIDKDELWNIYLNSFPEGTNEIYCTRREYDCSCCRHFLKSIGGTVFIDVDLNVHSIFEFDTGSSTFQPVMDALDRYVKSKPIIDVYFSESQTVGTNQNHEWNPDGSVTTWDHFFLKLPKHYVVDRGTVSTKMALFRDRRNVFKRSLAEISMDAIDIVLELIDSNTLYRGEEWSHIIATLKTLKDEHIHLPEEKKDLYVWRKTACIGDIIGKIRSHSIGVLLTDISEGMDLDKAVRRYENIVAPTNYKRPKAIFTKRMLEDAKRTITDLGYLDSLARRYATLDDITVNNILFSNRDSAKRIGGDIFDEMMNEVSIDAKRFSRVEEISAEKFVNDILPTAKEVEVLLENKHTQNMVSLIAPVNKEAPSMFKWSNGFSWAYTGNITDSDIRERVKNAGGNIDGVLRFSIQWNDTNEYSQNDLDAHAFTPSGTHIWFRAKRDYCTGGFLDVDIIDPVKGKPAVENIAWENKSNMTPGVYTFLVHQYTYHGGKDGFRAEIEFDGKIYQYNYKNKLRQGQEVIVAAVTLNADGTFSIKEHLNSTQATREVWGLKTNTFIPVSVVMYSPNYWDNQNGIGHRHYFFMLKGCVNPECPNGFYNEFLKSDLEKYKRVFEALGGKMAVANADDQLSGIGFSATKRNELVVKVKGATERVMKVKF